MIAKQESNPAILAADKEVAKLKAQDELLRMGNLVFGGGNRSMVVPSDTKPTYFDTHPKAKGDYYISHQYLDKKTELLIGNMRVGDTAWVTHCSLGKKGRKYYIDPFYSACRSWLGTCDVRVDYTEDGFVVDARGSHAALTFSDPSSSLVRIHKLLQND